MNQVKVLSQTLAQQLDQELMNPKIGGFSIHQLMELAGLSIAQAIFKVYPLNNPTNRVLICCGPGNNGGDGLVAARHLVHFGYSPTIYYPKANPNDLFVGLVTQLKHLNIEFTTEVERAKSFEPHLIIDAVFGFSFSGAVRSPFKEVIEWFLQEKTVPIVAVDVPSGWAVDEEPSKDIHYQPQMLISLTAPKPCSQFFTGSHHYLGGRFLPSCLAEKYGISNLPSFSGTEQCIKL